LDSGLLRLKTVKTVKTAMYSNEMVMLS
jgi:hypothetical protein